MKKHKAEPVLALKSPATHDFTRLIILPSSL